MCVRVRERQIIIASRIAFGDWIEIDWEGALKL